MFLEEKMTQKIQEILIYLTQRCNYSCKMCTQDGLPPIGEMGLDEWDKIFSNIEHDFPNCFLIFLGGEPTLYKHFDEILDCATKHNLRKHVVTNGSLLKGHLPAIKRNYCGVTISIDGLNQTHDKIRNARGAYDTAIDVIKEMYEYNKSVDDEKLGYFYYINYVMLPENIDETLGFIEELAKYKPKNIILNHTRYASFEKRLEMREEMTKIFDNPYNQHLMMRSIIDFPSDYVLKMNEIVKQAKSTFSPMVSEFPDLTEEERLAYYDDEKVYDLRPNWKCPSPYKIPTILPDGTVLSCLYNKLGNAYEQPISELWENDIAKKTRDYLNEHTKFLACGRCTCYYKPEKI